uniref:Uncharacterized protein n=1 Tax=Globodera pallida TaxID=36090 RepID=A0A183BPV8_GLOPA
MNCKSFTFLICAIVQFLLAKGVQSNSSDQLQDQKTLGFWPDLLKQNGISDDQLKQMARDMDEDEPFIEELSDEANYKPPPPSPAHPTFEKSYSMRFNSPSVALGVNDQNKIQKLEGQPGSFANVYRSLKLRNFFSLHLLMINGTIERKIVDNIDKEIKTMAKKKGISIRKIEKFNSKMELREIVKNVAIVWSETARNKNSAGDGEENSAGEGKENAQKIVELWQLIRKNEEFTNYLNENESEKAKNQNQKRRAKRTDPGTAAVIILVIVFFVFFFIYLGILWIAKLLGVK